MGELDGLLGEEAKAGGFTLTQTIFYAGNLKYPITIKLVGGAGTSGFVCFPDGLDIDVQIQDTSLLRLKFSSLFDNVAACSGTGLAKRNSAPNARDE
jgi:hypothetical protein